MFWAWVRRPSLNEFLAIVSSSLLTSHFSILVHVFKSLPLAKLLLTSNFHYLTDQHFPRSFYKDQTIVIHYSIHSFAALNCNLFLSYTAKIMTFGLTLHIHLTILASFLSSPPVITLPFLTAKVKLTDCHAP